ncbi:peptide deformylase [Streptomyces mirabilis]
MRNFGVVQQGAPILSEPARPFDLPAERDAAERVVESLFASMERIGGVHTFAKGMGIAAPQVGIGRAAAVVQPPEQGAGAIVRARLPRSGSRRRAQPWSSTGPGGTRRIHRPGRRRSPPP